MRLISFIVSTLIFLNCAYSQSEISETERNLIKSQGIRVKEQWDYKYSGNKLNGKGYVSSRTSYDTDGRILEIINYKNDSSILDISSFVYNSNGDRTEYVKFKGNKTTLVYKQSTQYKAPKQKLLEVGYNGSEDFRTQYSYDASGRLSEIKYYIAKMLDEIRTFNYKGNETTVEVKDSRGDVLSYIVSNYDDKNQLLEESKLDQEQKLIAKTQYTYDSNGHISSIEKKYPFKKPEHTEYVYDNAGKVQEVYFDGGDIPKFLKQSYSFASNGILTGEFWRNSPSSEQSYKKYKYDSNGRLVSTDCYFASYKYKVLNKFVYQSY